MAKTNLGSFKDNNHELLSKLDHAPEEIKKYARYGIYHFVHDMTKKVEASLLSKVNAGNSENQWHTPMKEGIRVFMWKTSSSVVGATVHVLGNMKTNDGTWRIRFMETGTEKRYVLIDTGKTTKRGRKITKNGKYLGQILSKHFFLPVVDEFSPLINNYLLKSIGYCLKNIEGK